MNERNTLLVASLSKGITYAYIGLDNEGSQFITESGFAIERRQGLVTTTPRTSRHIYHQRPEKQGIYMGIWQWQHRVGRQTVFISFLWVEGYVCKLNEVGGREW